MHLILAAFPFRPLPTSLLLVAPLPIAGLPQLCAAAELSLQALCDDEKLFQPHAQLGRLLPGVTIRSQRTAGDRDASYVSHVHAHHYLFVPGRSLDEREWLLEARDDVYERALGAFYL